VGAKYVGILGMRKQPVTELLGSRQVGHCVDMDKEVVEDAKIKEDKAETWAEATAI